MPTAPRPARLTTAPPIAVPNEMPTLNAAGSSELASVSALGWRSRAIRMKRVTHGTLHRYMSMPNAMMTASAAGIALPTSHITARTAACTRKTTTLALRPNFSSSTPESMFDTKRMAP